MAVTEDGEVLGEVSLPDAADAGVMLKFIHSYKKTFRFSQFKLSNTEFHGFRVHVFLVEVRIFLKAIVPKSKIIIPGINSVGLFEMGP